MDTLDNANNPFAIPNKTNNVVDSITAQTEDGLLLNFAEGLKKNDDLPNNDLIKMLEKSNCGRLSPDFDKEENLGPETNVDNPDSGPASPNFDLSKRHQREVINNNQNCNPFNDIEKSLELNLNLKEGTFEGLLMSPTEEECVQPPTTNSVHNVSQLIDAGAESDSEEDEEEWNYVRGEEANKENAKPLPLSSQVAEEEEEDDIENDAMSQLNPNAAEFIPSPARAVASPLGRLLDEDQVLSRSPKKPPPTEVDLNVPDICDFEKDISQKPREIEAAFGLNAAEQDSTNKPHENGHQDNFNNDTNAINALNSRLDEFHFGPNAAPFTPSKLLDQSEASSTRANFGDESAMTLGTSFNDSMLSQDQNDFVQKDDPMSMSFHQDRADDSNLFDLNKVHMLPENVDEFIANKEENTNSLFDDTISDLTEHYPLGKPEEPKQSGIEITTDLDHEDQKIDQLQINKSSTPIDERSKSPSGLQTPIEDDRAISPRDETQTPIEEASVASSIGECAIPKVEDRLEAPAETEHRLQSPFEQNKPSSPFEERLISPVVEHKLSSPYEEKEMYSTEEEKDICSPVEEKDICCLMRKQNEPQNEEKEVFEEKDLLSEKDIIQEEKYLIEGKQFIEDKVSLSEKEVIEEKDIFEKKYDAISPEPQRDISSPNDTNEVSVVQERDITSPQQEERLVYSPVEEKEIVQAVLEMEAAIPKSEEIVSSVQQEIISFTEERQNISPIQDREISSPVLEERDVYSPIEEKMIASPVQDEEITSMVQEVELASTQEECSLVDEGKAESPSLEQEISTAELKEDDFVPINTSESLDELKIEPSEVTTNCDNLESSQQKQEPVELEPSMNNEEFLKFETEKSDEEKAKENLESEFQLENSNIVLSPVEKSAEIIVDDSVYKNESLCDISTEPEKSADSQLVQAEESLLKEVASLSLAEQIEVPSSLAIDTSVDVHSQPTPEADQLLISDSNLQCSFNKSVNETSSVNTTDVQSALDQSLLGEVQCLISPNLSGALADITSEVVTSSGKVENELLKAEESAEILLSSPVREQQQDFSQNTSTPLANKLEVAPLSTQEKSPVQDKTPKAKEADKKTTKGKVTPSTTAKKTPTSRTSLGAAKTTATPSPKPTARVPSKTTTATSKLNSTAKTESATSKVASKPLSSKPSTTSAAPKPNSTAAKVPPSSRTNLRTALPKSTGTNGTAKPTTKPATGAIKKTEVSSNRSVTSTGTSKPASATSRTNVTSARSTTTTAAPKPRPNTLKPAPTRTVAAPKPTSMSAKPATTAAPRVPLTSRPTATKTSSSLATKEVSKTLSKPRSVTDKQVKETANKLTAASRTVSKTTSTMQSLAKSTTVTKKTEVTGTKTTTSRTTTTTTRAPIKRPADTSKTATTKLAGKPKQNGVAPVVTEKIIVSNGTKELDSMIDQFVKDNSPVDNKLITDKLSESAAN